MSAEIVMLCAAGALLSPAVAWQIVKRWPRNPKAEAAFLRQSFIDKRRSDGLAMDKIMSEMIRLEIFGRIRIKASAAVRANPLAAEEIIREEAKKELLEMIAAGNDLDARALGKAIDTLPLRDILDPAAYALWRDSCLALERPGLTEPGPEIHSAYAGRI